MASEMERNRPAAQAETDWEPARQEGKEPQDYKKALNQVLGLTDRLYIDLTGRQREILTIQTKMLNNLSVLAAMIFLQGIMLVYLFWKAARL